MNHDDIKAIQNADLLGLYRELNNARTEKANREFNWLTRQTNKLFAKIDAETRRIGEFIKSRNMPDPMQEKLHSMADKDTEYGRRHDDKAIDEAA